MDYIVNKSQVTNLVLNFLSPLKLEATRDGVSFWRNKDGQIVFSTVDSKNFAISYDFYFELKSLFTLDEEDIYSILEEICEKISGNEVESVYLRD